MTADTARQSLDAERELSRTLFAFFASFLWMLSRETDGGQNDARDVRDSEYLHRWLMSCPLGYIARATGQMMTP